MKKKPSSANNSPNRLRMELRRFIQAKIKNYVSKEEAAEEYLRGDPGYPQRTKTENRSRVELQIQALEKLWNRCLPYVMQIKSSHVKDIKEQTVAAACYLLFCRISQAFGALFLLAAEGYSYEAMVLLRTIRESLDLIGLFLTESEQHPASRKWFSGEIVGNKTARVSMDKFINDAECKHPVEETKAGIYTALSHYQHVSYAVMLESMNPFERDFDFQREAGFHYTVTGSLPSAADAIKATVIHLKHFSRYTNDNQGFVELSELLEDCQ
jgi:hypothetical protein